MNKYFLCFLIIVISRQTIAQGELDYRPITRFTDGMGIISPDTSYMINFRFRMQNRVGMFTNSVTDWRPDEFEARVRRLRLRMDGFLVNPKFSYYIQLSFSRGDQDWDNSRIPNVVRDAAVFYFFNDYSYLCFGQTKLPGNRQRVVSSGMLQFAERSIVNTEMNIDRDFGVRYFHQIGESVVFRNQVTISTGEGRNIITSDNGLAYTARTEILPLGKFTGDGDYFEGDLLREKSLKLALGATISYNHKAIRTGGQIGSYFSTPTDIRTFVADGIVKYQGFSLAVEVMYRNSLEQEVVLVENSLTSYIYNGTGINVQCSYLWPSNYELAARYANLSPKASIMNYHRGFNEIALGATRYFNNHRVKAQMNVSYLQEGLFSVNSTARWATMFQVEVGI